MQSQDKKIIFGDCFSGEIKEKAGLVSITISPSKIVTFLPNKILFVETTL
jgi:hypothetical protein